MFLTARISGMERLFAQLRSFPTEIKQKALNSALRKGAAPIRDEAKRLAPKRTGKLAANIKIATDKKPWMAGADARVVIFVAWRAKNDPKYWRYQEFGTSKAPPHPFLRPGFDTQKESALTLILSDLVQSIPKIVRTL